MPVRGIRGATTVAADSEEEILQATRALLQEMVSANGVQVDDLAAAYFTVTQDLHAAFPARAARDLGWTALPMLNGNEIPVPGSLRRCVRVLLWWNTDCPPRDVHHVYQREAVSLRPDWVNTSLRPEE
ncbi:MAG: chorismate mutase [Chloroflexi bacterium]|nr:chorismate mutase [Chloroflexota bacterium]